MPSAPVTPAPTARVAEEVPQTIVRNGGSSLSVSSLTTTTTTTCSTSQSRSGRKVTGRHPSGAPDGVSTPATSSSSSSPAPSGSGGSVTSVESLNIGKKMIVYGLDDDDEEEAEHAEVLAKLQNKMTALSFGAHPGEMGGSLEQRSGAPAGSSLRPDMSRFLPPSIVWEEEIEGRNTEFAVTVLGRQVVVVISQCGAVGSWVEACVDMDANVIDDGFAVAEQTYQTTVLFGVRSHGMEYQRVYARKLIELIHKENSDYTSVLLGIAMRDSSPKTFRVCMKSVQTRLEA